MSPQRSSADVVVLPVAATEQHGPHLPESTDVDIGQGILRTALEALEPEARPEVLPMIEVGVSEEHESFPNTHSVAAEEMIETIERIGSEVAASGGRRLVLVNSHGGNRFAMEAAGLRLRRAHGMLVVKASWFRMPRRSRTIRSAMTADYRRMSRPSNRSSSNGVVTLRPPSICRTRPIGRRHRVQSYHQRRATINSPSMSTRRCGCSLTTPRDVPTTESTSGCFQPA